MQKFKNYMQIYINSMQEDKICKQSHRKSTHILRKRTKNKYKSSQIMHKMYKKYAHVSKMYKSNQKFTKY